MGLDGFRLALRYLCSLNICVSVVSIIVGILTLVFLDEFKWSGNSGVGIWCGVAYLINAGIGLAFAATENMDLCRTKERRLLTAFQVFNGVCVSCAIQMLVYSSLAIKSCKNPGEEGQCVGDVIGIVASNGAAVAIGCMFVVIVVANYVMYGLLVRAVKTCSSSCKDGGESGQ